MKCTNCGNEVPDTAKVCGHCGHRLKAASAPIATPPPVTPAMRSLPGWVWGLGGAVIALIIIGAVAYKFASNPAAPASVSPQPPIAATSDLGAPAKVDLLSTLVSRGTLVVATDPSYRPQSALKATSQRTAGTKCTSDQKTLGELEGFDIDTAAAIAKGLDVEPCFVFPDWSLITAGSWSGRWDISVGSMIITPERAKVLYFAQPYYTNSVGSSFEYLAPAIDRQSTLDAHSLIAKVSEIVAGLHKDGTLLKLSQQWYRLDLTTAAASFDASEFGK